MNYVELRSLVREHTHWDFEAASNNLQNILFAISRTDVLSLITEIGIIPEDIGHDSSEENYIRKFRISYSPKLLKR